ncbi:DNA mismatch repair protein MutS [Halobacteriales archaeon SW_7_68_16]|nr:MAG: DNA mismatch repair protein MutS [Halobacteriales archaeon SW_7_68_16]
MDADTDAAGSGDDPTIDPGAVTGPQATVQERVDELTPMLRQYHDVCTAHENALVLFQVGDFYKAYCDAAGAVARIAEVTLTEREDSTGTYSMVGIPVENAAGYVDSLLAAGYRVAIAEQVEDPETVSGVAERAVTRVVTPGTVTDDELVSPDATYVASIARDTDDAYGLALVDVSTGELLATGGDRATVTSELDRFDPAEIVRGPTADLDRSVSTIEADDADLDAPFDPDRARERLRAVVGEAGVETVGSQVELRACGGALAYAAYTQGGLDALASVDGLERYDPRGYARLDATAIRSLELFESRGPDDGTALFDVIDGTVTALGRRRLADWLRRPLVDPEAIRARHEAVAALADGHAAREAVRAALTEVYDLERLITRVARNRADARDLRALADSLSVVPTICEHLADLAGGERLRALTDALDDVPAIREKIDRAIRSEPPREITEGGIFQAGYDEDLDALRDTRREGEEWIADLERRERERTGIDSLSVGHTEVHGYYIEVTDANLDRVPDDYTRRQTLKNSERFYTPELKRREDEILSASERSDAREHQLFVALREDVGDAADAIQALADAVAAVDALCALATVAVDRDYVRPTVDAPGIEIETGRHPVVETETEFVPNDTDLVAEPLAIVTGPNMSGKSTYMRQVALIVVLAQAGSFVPADAARLPVVDRVFTRVGASDDIAGGESTFMREMREVTTILGAATEDSLILLDEVGRGTSTVDGEAIARAVTEFVHNEIGATTLFATHYHDLTGLADELPDAQALHFDAARDGDEVYFLHDIRPGAASSSYGVEVARMAGVPESVVDRARELVKDDSDDADGTTARSVADGSDPVTSDEPEQPTAGTRDVEAADVATDVDVDPAVARGIAAEIGDLDLANTTPLEALTRLDRYRRRIEEE